MSGPLIYPYYNRSIMEADVFQPSVFEYLLVEFHHCVRVVHLAGGG